MNTYYKIIGMALAIIALTGCELLGGRLQQNQGEITQPPVIVEQPPKMIKTDWKTILTPLIDELLETAEVDENNQLLVSDIKNKTNAYISSPRLNNIILNQLSSQDIFKIIDKTTINQAKQILGISYDDTLVSRSKMIALARHIGANYVLFTSVNQAPTPPDTEAIVEMELLLTKTGEIVWQYSTDQLVDAEQTE